MAEGYNNGYAGAGSTSAAPAFGLSGQMSPHDFGLQNPQPSTGGDFGLASPVPVDAGGLRPPNSAAHAWGGPPGSGWQAGPPEAQYGAEMAGTPGPPNSFGGPPGSGWQAGPPGYQNGAEMAGGPPESGWQAGPPGYQNGAEMAGGPPGSGWQAGPPGSQNGAEMAGALRPPNSFGGATGSGWQAGPPGSQNAAEMAGALRPPNSFGGATGSDWQAGPPGRPPRSDPGPTTGHDQAFGKGMPQGPPGSKGGQKGKPRPNGQLAQFPPPPNVVGRPVAPPSGGGYRPPLEQPNMHQWRPQPNYPPNGVWPAHAHWNEATPLKELKTNGKHKDKHEKKDKKSRRKRKANDGEVACDDLCVVCGRKCFAFFCCFATIPGLVFMGSVGICVSQTPKTTTTTTTTSYYYFSPEDSEDDLVEVEESIIADATTTTTTTTVSTLPAYWIAAPWGGIYSDSTNHECPSGYVIITSLSGCHSATNYLGKNFHSVINMVAHPKGCFLSINDNVFFNEVEQGQYHIVEMQLCKAVNTAAVTDPAVSAAGFRSVLEGGHGDTVMPASQVQRTTFGCTDDVECNATCTADANFESSTGNPKDGAHKCECPRTFGSRRRNALCCRGGWETGYSYVPALYCGTAMAFEVDKCKTNSDHKDFVSCDSWSKKPGVDYFSMKGSIGDTIRYYAKRAIEKTKIRVTQDMIDKTFELDADGKISKLLLTVNYHFKGFVRGWVALAENDRVIKAFENMKFEMTVTNGLDKLEFKSNEVMLPAYITWDGTIDLDWTFGEKNTHAFSGYVKPSVSLSATVNVPDGGIRIKKPCNLNCPIGATLHYVAVKMESKVVSEDLGMWFELDCNNDDYTKEAFICTKIRDMLESDFGQGQALKQFEKKLTRMLEKLDKTFQKTAIRVGRPIMAKMHLYLWQACFACFWIGGCDGKSPRNMILQLNYLYLAGIAYVVFLIINCCVCGCCCVTWYREKQAAKLKDTE